MSVIQDALRRKLDEQKEARAGRPAPAPVSRPRPQAPPVAQQVLENEPYSTPIATVGTVRPRAPAASPPPPPAAAPRDQRTVQFLLGAILLMLVAAFGGAVVYFLQVRDQDLLRAVTSPPAGPVGSPVGAEGGGSPGVAVAGGPGAVPAVAPDSGSETLPPPAPVAAVEPPVVALAPGAWPLIKVEGVMAGSEPSLSSALLNNEMIRVRHRIEGVRLLEVREEGVLLEYKGKSRFVETGTTTRDEFD